MGAGKSLNRREKNSGAEKSRTRITAPGDKVLTDQFQTVGVILASDWCHKIVLFLCSITDQQDYESFRVFLLERNVHASCSPYVGRGIYSRRKIPFTAENVGEFRKNLAGNTLNLSRV